MRRLVFVLFALHGALATSEPALAQATVLSGNHVIDGNLCVGTSCVASEGFSRGPLTVKGPRTAIGFVDTSGSGAPTRDWSIVGNDYPNGQSCFGIDDIEGNGIVFRIRPDAPQNALVIAGDGRIGVGTGMPAGHVHIRSGV